MWLEVQTGCATGVTISLSGYDPPPPPCLPPGGRPGLHSKASRRFSTAQPASAMKASSLPHHWGLF